LELLQHCLPAVLGVNIEKSIKKIHSEKIFSLIRKKWNFGAFLFTTSREEKSNVGDHNLKKYFFHEVTTPISLVILQTPQPDARQDAKHHVNL